MKVINQFCPRWRTRIGGSALVAAMLFPAALFAAAADGEQLTQKARELLVAVAQQDSVALDALVCMDSISAEHLRRKAKLGLVEDADDPAVIAGFRSDYREAIVRSLSGFPAEQANIGLGPGGPSASPEGVETVETLKVGGQPKTITAQATLSVDHSGRAIDIPAIQLDSEQWCLLPRGIP